VLFELKQRLPAALQLLRNVKQFVEGLSLDFLAMNVVGAAGLMNRPVLVLQGLLVLLTQQRGALDFLVMAMNVKGGKAPDIAVTSGQPALVHRHNSREQLLQIHSCAWLPAVAYFVRLIGVLLCS
jgi:hypothetical protein